MGAREDQRWWFVFYTAVYVVEPASGQQRLKRTLRDHEDGGQVFVYGRGYVQTERDAVAVRAANEVLGILINCDCLHWVLGEHCPGQPWTESGHYLIGRPPAKGLQWHHS